MGRVTKPAGDYAVTEVDRALVAQVRLAVNDYANLPASKNNIHIIVDNGMVTLQGWVPTEQDRMALGQRVTGVSGVQQLDNQLRVGTPDGRLGGR
jgi:osmotically-inducible protein OsmY